MTINDDDQVLSAGSTLVDSERVRQMAADLGIIFDVIEFLDLRPQAPA